jgi:hypothetical protein
VASAFGGQRSIQLSYGCRPEWALSKGDPAPPVLSRSAFIPTARSAFEAASRIGHPLRLAAVPGCATTINWCGGIFALLRHPIYAGMSLFLIALAAALGHLSNLILAAPLFLLGTTIRAIVEERLLRERFGEDYEAYARSVKRFIPGIFERGFGRRRRLRPVAAQIGDLYRWDRALRTDALLPKFLRDRIFAPAKGHFGLGWEVETEDGRRTIEHNGDINGFGAFIARYPDDDAVILILTDMDGTRVREIKDAISGPAANARRP